MRPIDPYSYHCGVMDSFCEIVGAGVKPMALSHPFASPEERAEYREYAAKMAGQYGNEQVTILNLVAVKIDAEKNLIAVKGAVPGSKGGIVFVRDSVKA